MVSSMPSRPTSNGTERRGTPASWHRGAADNPCGSATSSRGSGRVPGSGGFGRRGASYVSPSTPSFGSSTTGRGRCALWWRAVASSSFTCHLDVAVKGAEQALPPPHGGTRNAFSHGADR